jgi:hypothetical protein
LKSGNKIAASVCWLYSSALELDRGRSSIVCNVIEPLNSLLEHWNFVWSANILKCVGECDSEFVIVYFAVFLYPSIFVVVPSGLDDKVFAYEILLHDC